MELQQTISARPSELPSHVHAHPPLQPRPRQYDACVAICRDGRECSRAAVEFCDLGGAVWLCRQHAKLHRQIEWIHGKQAADERIGYGFLLSSRA